VNADAIYPKIKIKIQFAASSIRDNGKELNMRLVSETKKNDINKRNV